MLKYHFAYQQPRADLTRFASKRQDYPEFSDIIMLYCIPSVIFDYINDVPSIALKYQVESK